MYGVEGEETDGWERQLQDVTHRLVRVKNKREVPQIKIVFVKVIIPRAVVDLGLCYTM